MPPTARLTRHGRAAEECKQGGWGERRQVIGGHAARVRRAAGVTHTATTARLAAKTHFFLLLWQSRPLLTQAHGDVLALDALILLNFFTRRLRVEEKGSARPLGLLGVPDLFGFFTWQHDLSSCGCGRRRRRSCIMRSLVKGIGDCAHGYGPAREEGGKRRREWRQQLAGHSRETRSARVRNDFVIIDPTHCCA